jgi:hypothetical protein
VVAMFNSLLNVFSQRFVIVLEGEPIAPSYVVDWMLGKFAAVVVVYAMNVSVSLEKKNHQYPSNLLSFSSAVLFTVRGLWSQEFLMNWARA